MQTVGYDGSQRPPATGLGCDERGTVPGPVVAGESGSHTARGHAPHRPRRALRAAIPGGEEPRGVPPSIAAVEPHGGGTATHELEIEVESSAEDVAEQPAVPVDLIEERIGLERHGRTCREEAPELAAGGPREALAGAGLRRVDLEETHVDAVLEDDRVAVDHARDTRVRRGARRGADGGPGHGGDGQQRGDRDETGCASTHLPPGSSSIPAVSLTSGDVGDRARRTDARFTRRAGPRALRRLRPPSGARIGGNHGRRDRESQRGDSERMDFTSRLADRAWAPAPLTPHLRGRSAAKGSVMARWRSRKRKTSAGRPPARPDGRRSPVGSITARRSSTRRRFVADTSWPSAAT